MCFPSRCRLMPILLLASDNLCFLFQSKGTFTTTMAAQVLDRPSNQISFSFSAGNVRRKILGTEGVITCLQFFLCWDTCNWIIGDIDYCTSWIRIQVMGQIMILWKGSSVMKSQLKSNFFCKSVGITYPNVFCAFENLCISL